MDFTRSITLFAWGAGGSKLKLTILKKIKFVKFALGSDAVIEINYQ